MTDFEIVALALPIVGFVFLACFAFVLMRLSRAAAEGEVTKVAPAGLKQAAE
jgi:hypothetical protein